eukprot:gnl/Spiro4/4826_TR2415_c0_g1_i1.p1 gnl/Spiro4/4826_TR2415_c0_g1~~gnl/Spiro4/4826_TR2415_c0_g1_i1.p1  ORF type:complete len:372 (+),score=81.25 gnl/Spiro4/4826_TR2415_c0_g1_i1:41-1117(+)
MAASATDERFAFVADWFDKPAGLTKRINVLYFPSNNSVELIDVKLRRVILRRAVCTNLIGLSQFHIGATVTVFGKQLTLTDYLDEYTRNKLGAVQEKCCAIIMGDAYPALGQILSAIYEAQLKVNQIVLRRPTADQAGELLKDMQLANADELVGRMSQDLVCFLELLGADVCAQWRALTSQRSGLRSAFGDAFFGSLNGTCAVRECALIAALPTTAMLDNCTLCIIKPHAVLAGQAGHIIDALISQGFDISAIQMFTLDRACAEEFLEVYRDVVTDFNAMAEELCSSACIAMEVRQQDAVTKLREMCGPADPEMARVLRPNSLRARFGISTARNAVHCTDLVEDGNLEVEYFFSVLQG